MSSFGWESVVEKVVTMRKFKLACYLFYGMTHSSSRLERRELSFYFMYKSCVNLVCVFPENSAALVCKSQY